MRIAGAKGKKGLIKPCKERVLFKLSAVITGSLVHPVRSPEQSVAPSSLSELYFCTPIRYTGSAAADIPAVRDCRNNRMKSPGTRAFGGTGITAHTLSLLCYSAAYAAGLTAFLWIADRRRFPFNEVLTLAGVALGCGLLIANLTQWVVAGSAGKTVLGGILGGYIAVTIYKRHLGWKRSTGDLFAVAIVAGEAIGRWGCFFGGCCYGRMTDVPWAVWQHGAWRHPTQIYLSLCSMVILFVLLRQERRNPPDGELFCLQGILYCIMRFAVEMLRVVPARPAGLSAAQWACLGGLVFFVNKIFSLQRQREVPLEALSRL